MLTDKVLDACNFAQAAHEGQTRWDKKTPYFTHVKAVADSVFTKEQKIVAYLHDTVEDTDVTLSEIIEIFGHGIGNAVDAITKREGEDYDVYIDRVCSDPIALVVKQADIRHNLSCGIKKGSMRDKYLLALKYISLKQDNM